MSQDAMMGRRPLVLTIAAVLAIAFGLFMPLLRLFEMFSGSARQNDFLIFGDNVKYPILLLGAGLEVAFGVHALRLKPSALALGIISQLVFAFGVFGYWQEAWSASLLILPLFTVLPLFTIVYLLLPSTRQALGSTHPVPSGHAGAAHAPSSTGSLTILASLAVAAGVLGLFAAPFLIFLIAFGWGMTPSRTTPDPDFSLAWALIVAAIVELAFGIGALRRKLWGWVLGLIAQVVVAALVVLVTLGTHGLTTTIIAGILIPGLIVAYLLRPEIKQEFGLAHRHPGERPHPL